MCLAIRLAVCCCVLGVCLTADLRGGPTPPETANSVTALPAPPVEADLPVLPINLPAALQLANSQPIDVQVAAVRIKAALAGLDLAWAQWLPTISFGGDYSRHDGAIQSSDGSVSTNSHSSLMFGAGTGIGSTNETLSFNAAIFGPLVAKQIVRAREADRQTALNDSMLAVTDAYFNVQQARGNWPGQSIQSARPRNCFAEFANWRQVWYRPWKSAASRRNWRASRRPTFSPTSVGRWTARNSCACCVCKLLPKLSRWNRRTCSST